MSEGRSVPTLYPLLLVLAILLFLIYATSRQTIFGSGSNQTLEERSSNYAIVMDAGSSGTRAYLYEWPDHSGNSHDLLQLRPLTSQPAGEPLVRKVSPGLSSLAKNPENALTYIKPLLDFALKHIPENKHKETPLYILATAGMRLLDKEAQDSILSKLRTAIQETTAFYFPAGHLEIISGKQEGVYQWLAINYVLGKLDHHNGGQEELVAVETRDGKDGAMVFRPRTVGALDMGGASMQVAMEITTDLQMEGMSEKEKGQVMEVQLGCLDHDTEHTYRLFVTTYLGFGANQAMERYYRHLFVTTAISNGLQGVDTENRLKDPCSPIGMKHNISLILDLDHLSSIIGSDLANQLLEKQVVHLYGTGDWETCYSKVTNFTKQRDTTIACRENCPDEGIKKPPIQFDNSEFYGFSEFWYSMEDVLGLGGQYMFRKYKEASKEFCSTKWHISWTKYLQGSYPDSDSERLSTQCFKSVWLTVALHEGLAFPQNYGHLTGAPETVQGKVVHWTLGALLYRTRFYPLRAIEGTGGVVHQGSGQHHGGYLYSHYIVYICLLAVSLCILLYVIRLRRYVKPSTLRKVPSIAYWTQQDIDEEAQREQADHLFATTKVFVG